MNDRHFPPFNDDDPFIIKLISVIFYVLSDPYIIAGATIGVTVTLLVQIHEKLKLLMPLLDTLP